MMRGSDSTTARSSTLPPMVAGPMLRNFRFFRMASCAVCAMALPVNRANNRRMLAKFMTVSWGGSPFYPIRQAACGMGWEPATGQAKACPPRQRHELSWWLEAVAEGQDGVGVAVVLAQEIGGVPAQQGEAGGGAPVLAEGLTVLGFGVHALAVLAHDCFEGQAAIDVDGVSGVRHHGAREATHG